VPAYPASHGCVRVSVAAMDMIWEQDILPRGTTVVVYGEIS
jgi:lipoprotein-anchoring transpeptidase ErfK/SrfK